MFYRCKTSLNGDESDVLNSRTNRILLVDDEIDIILTFTKGLKRYGFEVDSSDDPGVAILNSKSDLYGLLLLDIRMPKMNGFELYKKMREKVTDVRVCFITSYKSYYDALKKDYPTLDIGCFIQKPISIPVLVERICKELQIPLRSEYIE